MTQNKNFLFGLTLLLVAAFISCDKKPTQPENARVYAVTLKTSSSSPVSGATVSIQTREGEYRSATDKDGEAQIAIPNEVALPAFVIVTADHSTIMPEGRSLPGAQDSNTNRTITCEPAPSRILVREAALHHVGDDHYTGDPNSQLQISTEGVRQSFAFSLSGIPGSMPYIRFFARGIQRRTKIQINGVTVNHLGDSSADGDLSRYSFQLTANPATVFRTGTNVLTVETGYDSSIDDWDDIEFCGLLLYYP